MFCPRCSNQIVENQNYCRNCGLNVGVIVDAMQEKTRGRFDFEPVIRSLHDLGSSLRAGWEEASNAFHKNRKSREIGRAALSSDEVSEIISHNISKALIKAKAAHSRTRSFQQATLSILRGGGITVLWYYLLNATLDSGLLQNLQTIILEKTGTLINIDGLSSVIRMLWILGLIPVIGGIAHLINGIFFAGKEEKGPVSFFAPAPAQNPVQSQPAVSAITDPPTTKNLEQENTKELSVPQEISVTEDSTLRFEAK